MLTKFYENTIVTKFIKHLVAANYTPLVNTWLPGQFAIEGLCYITEQYIVKALHSGYPEHIDSLNENGELFFEKISPYVTGASYANITTNHISNIQGYDSKTHYYLGQYLRLYRDLHGVDLMPLYNCVTNEYITDLDFDSNVTFSSTNGIKGINKILKENTSYKILSVPIKFGQTYSIGLSSESPISLLPIIYSDKGFLERPTEQLYQLINASGKSITINKPRTAIRDPFIIKTPSWNDIIFHSNFIEDLYQGNAASFTQHEKYLRLLIKIPSSVETSVVVLEGDYSLDSATEDYYLSKINVFQNINTPTPSGYNIEYVGDVPESKFKLISPLSLLQMNDKQIYAFSNTLIEYLLLNVITPADNIKENVERIQQYMRSVENQRVNEVVPFRQHTVPGVWNFEMRKYLFELTKKSPIISQKLDLMGFVDKNTERVITRGQGV